jgi:hypothetical protein
MDVEKSFAAESRTSQIISTAEDIRATLWILNLVDGLYSKINSIFIKGKGIIFYE